MVTSIVVYRLALFASVFLAFFLASGPLCPIEDQQKALIGLHLPTLCLSSDFLVHYSLFVCRIAPGNGALGLLGEEGEDVDDNELGEEEAADDDELYAGDDNPYDQYDDDEGYDDPDDDGGEDPYF